MRGQPTDDPEIEISNIASPLKIKELLPLFNVPAFCYVLRLPKSQPEALAHYHANFPLTVYTWVSEAWAEWIKSAQDPDIVKCDIKDPFNLVNVDQGLSISIITWLGQCLGVRRDLIKPIKAEGLQKDGLETLFQHHRRLCDLVDDQAHSPLFGLDTVLSVRKSPWEIDQLRSINPVASPVCYAVLLMATERLHEKRRVLLILTGDNARMHTTPTFESIPEPEIFARKGENIVEVSLDTAVRYLRYVDTAEEKMNDVLRSATEIRSKEVALELQEESKVDARKWLTGGKEPDRMIHPGSLMDLHMALRQVMRRRGIAVNGSVAWHLVSDVIH